MTTLQELLADLQDEYGDLRRLIGSLATDAPEWDQPTPAEGWAVRDQISHLAYFDDAGRLAVVEPETFAKEAELVMGAVGDPMEVHLVRGRAMTGDELLGWWDVAHQGMMEVFAGADSTTRVPWYGPPMGVLSFVSARLMEIWAHGQDVVDALALARPPTDRLRHVAHLGVRARPFSYAVRGRDVPTGRIDVILTAPSGESWQWQIGDREDGEPPSLVQGPALDFCLVVTQRRNVLDTELVVEGETGTDWISVAQAFAGPPSPGRPPLGSQT